MDFNHFPTFEDAQKKLFEAWNTRYSKYPLASVSDTLDTLLNEYFDPADKRRTEFIKTDLGEIEYKGEKVMVKIKVVRGE